MHRLALFTLSFYRPGNDRFPYLFTSLKGYPFRVDPPRVGCYRVYPPPWCLCASVSHKVKPHNISHQRFNNIKSSEGAGQMATRFMLVNYWVPESDNRDAGLNNIIIYTANSTYCGYPWSSEIGYL